MKMWVLSVIAVLGFGSVSLKAEYHIPTADGVDGYQIPGQQGGSESQTNPNSQKSIDACVNTQGNPAVRPGSERTPSVSSYLGSGYDRK